MEISGKVLREVEFRDRLRGYDTDEVDEFLENVAVAVDELRAELDALRQRAASQAEPTPDDDAIRRTLVLAQRTADLAIKEANEEASRILESARAQAQALVAGAEERARQLESEAADDLTQRIARLGEERRRLELELAALVRLAEAERERLSAGLTAALRQVEQGLAVSEAARAALEAAQARLEASEPAAPASDGVPAEGAGEAAPDAEDALWARWTSGVDLGPLAEPGAEGADPGAEWRGGWGG
ncbi:MAG TPA: DivIVA domain-containing protein [Acidimicrobiales bacterium]|nr:DivIVA domain-containing protein [Acidimicrobiales bacterium]